MVDYTQLIQNILTAVVGLTSAAVLFLTYSPVMQEKMRSWKIFKKSSTGAAISAVEDLEELTNKFDQFPGVKKGVLIQITNGGGKPQPGCVLYMSTNYPQKWRSLIQSMPIDGEYSKYVLDVYEKGYAVLDVESLSPDGQLTEIFHAHGVDLCHLFSIKKTPEKFFIVAIDYYDYSLVETNAYVKNQIRMLVNEIKNVLNG